MEMKVDLDGSGTYRTVQEAIDNIPLNNKQRVVIRIAPGIYKQPIYIPKTKNLITFSGLDAHQTILTWFNTATSIQHHQTDKVIGTGTFACGSVIVEGADFIAENVTFENAAPKGSGQAVAIRVTADRCAFYGCRFLGWQDTAYLHYGRQYFRDCYIEGSVDFIFGNATVLLEYCQIFCKSKGFITAQQRKLGTETTGYVFLRCTITGTGESKPYAHLGRPWGPYARVLFAYTWMDGCVTPSGWDNWGNSQNENTACYYEYRCTGVGSDTRKRVPWARRLNYDEAAPYLSTLFVDPQGSWLNVKESLNVPTIPVPLSAGSEASIVATRDAATTLVRLAASALGKRMHKSRDSTLSDIPLFPNSFSAGKACVVNPCISRSGRVTRHDWCELCTGGKEPHQMNCHRGTQGATAQILMPDGSLPSVIMVEQQIESAN